MAEASADETVTVTVDDEVCIGVGQCELLEPDSFRVDDDDGIARVLNGGHLPRGRAEVVVDKCPSGAISIVGETGGS